MSNKLGVQPSLDVACAIWTRIGTSTHATIVIAEEIDRVRRAARSAACREALAIIDGLERRDFANADPAGYPRLLLSEVRRLLRELDEA